MPNVPYSPVPTVAPPDRPPPDQMDIQASPQAFGSQIGQAMEGMGQTLQKGSDELWQHAVDFAKMNDAATARGAGIQIAQKMGQRWSDYRQKEGQDAFNGYNDFVAGIQKDRADTIASMPNPYTRELLSNNSAYLIDRWQLTGAGYAADQRKAWLTQSHKADQENAQTQGVLFQNQPDAVLKYGGDLEKSVREEGQARGWDEATTTANVAAGQGAYYRNVIGSLLQTNPAAAQAMFDQVKGKLDGPSIEVIGGALERKRDDTGDNAYVGNLLGQTSIGTGTAGPIEPAARARAVAVSTGMEKRGLDHDTALGFAANALHESAANPNSGPGDGGASHGLFMWNQERLAEFQQIYHHLPEQGTLDEALDFAVHELNSPQYAGAKAAIEAAQGPAAKAAAISRAFLMPRDVVGEQQRRGATAAQLASSDTTPGGAAAPDPSKMSDQEWLDWQAKTYPTLAGPNALPPGVQVAGPGAPTDTTPAPGAAAPTSPRGAAIAAPDYPDRSALFQQVIRENPDPKVQGRRLALLNQALTAREIATETDRKTLTDELANRSAAALDGREIDIPEDAIRRLYPPAQAAKLMEELRVDQQAGRLFAGIKYDSPQRIDEITADLNSHTGPISSMIRHQGVPLAPGQTDQQSSEDPSSDAYRLHMQVAAKWDQAVKNRQAMLTGDKADPAGYMQAEPGVAAAAAAIKADPKDPNALYAYNNAQLAAQANLGVPAAQRHILTRGQAQANAQTLMTADPTKDDMGARLDGLARQYGDHWQQAFGDMVTLGGLPREYQTLGIIQNPVVRHDFQDMLGTMKAKGGLENLKQAAGDDASRAIEQAIDPALAAFKRTAYIPGVVGNVGQIDEVRASVRDLALYYAVNGDSGARAVDKATQGILGDRYDFDGTARVPKGTLPQVHAAQQALLEQMKPADYMPTQPLSDAAARDPGITLEDRQGEAVAAAGRGSWIPNRGDTGLILVGQDRDGARSVMKRADGTPIELLFRDVPKLATSRRGMIPTGTPMPSAYPLQ